MLNETSFVFRPLFFLWTFFLLRSFSLIFKFNVRLHYWNIRICKISTKHHWSLFIVHCSNFMYFIEYICIESIHIMLMDIYAWRDRVTIKYECYYYISYLFIIERNNFVAIWIEIFSGNSNWNKIRSFLSNKLNST